MRLAHFVIVGGAVPGQPQDRIPSKIRHAAMPTDTLILSLKWHGCFPESSCPTGPGRRGRPPRPRVFTRPTPRRRSRRRWLPRLFVGPRIRWRPILPGHPQLYPVIPDETDRHDGRGPGFFQLWRFGHGQELTDTFDYVIGHVIDSRLSIAYRAATSPRELLAIGTKPHCGLSTHHAPLGALADGASW